MISGSLAATVQAQSKYRCINGSIKSKEDSAGEVSKEEFKEVDDNWKKWHETWLALKKKVEDMASTEITADEMFEELGYVCTEEVIELSDSYSEKFYNYKKYDNNGIPNTAITFVIPRNKVYIGVSALTAREIEAVNMKARELGW